MRKNLTLITTLAIVAALIPVLIDNRFYLHIGVMVGINIILVTGLSIVARTGRLSMGHSAFAAIGGYSTVLLVMKLNIPWLAAALLGLCLSASIAFVLGRVIVKLRGVYFVLVTFSFAEFVRLLLLEWTDLTGGASGVAGIPPLNLFGFQIQAVHQWYAVVSFLAIIITFIVQRFFTTVEGTAFLATDANADLAEATGINVARTQLTAFGFGATVTAFGGILYSGYLGFISPESFNVHMSITLVTMLVVGGVRSTWAPVVGSIILTPLPELLRGALHYQHLLYGVFLVAILMFLPRGIGSIASPEVRKNMLKALGRSNNA